MSYGRYALDPIENRVAPVTPPAYALSTGLRPGGRPLPHAPRPDDAHNVPPRPTAQPPELPALSPAALRAKAVSGLLDARRADLVRADRALATAGTALKESLAALWPARPDSAGSRWDPREGRAVLARAVQDGRRLASDVQVLSRAMHDDLDHAVHEVNERAAQVAELNVRIDAAQQVGQSTQAWVRRREELVLSLARLAGATAQPGAGESLTVVVDGLPLVTGADIAPLRTAVDADGQTSVIFADGRSLTLTSGILAGRLGTLVTELPAIAAAVNTVLAHLAHQATDPAGGGVIDGTAAGSSAEELARRLRELSRATESSSAYARVASGVSDVVWRAAATGADPARYHPDLFLGAVQAPDLSPPAITSGRHITTLQRALSDLAQLAGALAAPGRASATATVISGAPGIATPVVTPDAPAGTATLRVLSMASPAVVGTAQSFHPDSPLGDGRERIIGVVTALGTPHERTTIIDVGTYPTPGDLASLINHANAGVHATLWELTGGTVQLRLQSLATGRGQDITILDGGQPPAVSAVLGRVVTLSAPRDTVVEVHRPRQAAVLAQGSGVVLRDVLPGVEVLLRTADPTRTFEVGVRRSSSDAVDLAARTVQGAARAIEAAIDAGAPATADHLRTIVGVPTDSGAAAAQATPRPLVPGLHLTRAGRPEIDPAALAAGFENDPSGTAQAVSTMARGLASIARDADAAIWEAYATARAAQGVGVLDTYRPSDARRPDVHRPAVDLTRQEHALLAVLARLQGQEQWLGRQLTHP